MSAGDAHLTIGDRLASAIRGVRNRANGIRRLQSYWGRLGRDDPMWAVLTRPEQWEEDEFFSTGAAEIASVMEYVASLGVPARRERALDFGCGVGRLTRPLAGYFDQVVGVDIAESMIEAAERLNASISNCEFRHNLKPDLAGFESASFDFIYSNITLQHMAPALAKRYLREFVRVLADDGLLLFQLPGGRPERYESGTTGSIRRTLNSLLRPAVAMYYVPREEVVDTLRSAGGRVLEVQTDSFAGPTFDSYRYAVVPAKRR
jgi:SAM-dependent methyltransferase